MKIREKKKNLFQRAMVLCVVVLVGFSIIIVSINSQTKNNFFFFESKRVSDYIVTILKNNSEKYFF